MFPTKSMLFLIFLPLSICYAFAQEEEIPPYKEPQGTNNWYVELGGAAMFYSINYEKILFRNEKASWSGRVGIGYNPFNYSFLNKVYLDQNTTMAPFHTSFSYGKKEKLELGGGFTLLAKSVNDREVVPFAVLGLRVVETNKIFFRITYNPIWRNDNLVHWYGVSLGKNFDFK